MINLQQWIFIMSIMSIMTSAIESRKLWIKNKRQLFQPQLSIVNANQIATNIGAKITEDDYERINEKELISIAQNICKCGIRKEMEENPNLVRWNL